MGNLEQSGHGLLVERLRFYTVCFEPFLHLHYAVRIFKPGQSLQSVRQLLLCGGIHLDGILHQGHIEPYSSVIDFLVEHILIPHRLRHRVFGQSLLNRHFHFHVAPIVGFEKFPLIARRLMKGRYGETANERLALGHFLSFQTQYTADGGK